MMNKRFTLLALFADQPNQKEEADKFDSIKPVIHSLYQNENVKFLVVKDNKQNRVDVYKAESPYENISRTVEIVPIGYPGHKTDPSKVNDARVPKKAVKT